MAVTGQTSWPPPGTELAACGQFFMAANIRLRSMESFDVGDGLVRVQATVTALERDDRLLESAVSRLSLEPHVTTVGLWK